PAGPHADWSMRGALTEGDISSWFLAAAYTTRAPAGHQYEVGLTYSTQRYDEANPAVFHQMIDGSRNVGEVSARDTITMSDAVALTYGASYARYGYLTGPGLFSPNVGLTITPVAGLRMGAQAASQSLAPGAEEFLPPSSTGIWLPPQRTFSSLV